MRPSSVVMFITFFTVGLFVIGIDFITISAADSINYLVVSAITLTFGMGMALFATLRVNDYKDRAVLFIVSGFFVAISPLAFYVNFIFCIPFFIAGFLSLREKRDMERIIAPRSRPMADLSTIGQSKCPKCGATISSGASYCLSCKARLR